jgi:uncharacterized protein YecT (DUF1311 family)
MSTDDFTPDLTKLEQDYQILTELHRSRDSRTYLARHLELNRDVTITVVRRGAGGAQSLSRFAGDVERLRTARHPNIIPVIEGRWLGDGCFAVARARVRGSSLDQLVSSIGAIPLATIANSLHQVQSALEWARTNAIANRTVDHDSMIFQQGSGRVLLSLEPARAPSSTTDNCDDVRVVGRLAWEMLAGEAYDAESVKSLAILRPDLAPSIVSATEGLVRCEAGTVVNVGAYIAMLSGSAAAESPLAAVAAGAAVPSTSALGLVAATADRVAPVRTPAVGSAVDPGVVRSHGMSFGARFASAVAVVAVIVLVAFFFVQRSGRPVADRTTASAQGQKSGEAAGDVEDTSVRPDTAAMPSSQSSVYPTTTTPVATPTSRPAPAVVQTPAPVTAQPPSSGLVPPATRRHEPMTTTPSLTFPAPAASIDSGRAAPPDSTVTMQVSDVCSSPTDGDQHKCLMNAIDRNDVALNAVYQQLNAALRRQANVTIDNPNPESIDRLHEAERQWMDERDQACHTVGGGPLYARERAQCFAEQSAKRTRDLQQMLDAIPNQ